MAEQQQTEEERLPAEQQQTEEERLLAVTKALAVAQALQTAFWDAIRDLEAQLGGDCDTFDLASRDLEDWDAATLISDWDAENEEEESDAAVKQN